MVKVLLFLVFILLILVSGCSTDTGKVAETTKLTIPETPSEQNQTSENIEELHKEFAEFEKSQSENQSHTGGMQTTGEISSKEQIQEPPKKCPSCEDNNSCTKDFCSKETGYECRHEAIIPCCGNGKCEEGENWSLCSNDCKKQACNLSCRACEILNNETCSCGNITQCISDGCCPSGCNYTSDSDCPNPDLCQTDSDCDDNNPCTQDVCSGQPKNCSYSPVTECFAGDGCCPEGCTYFSDLDCEKPSVVFSEIYYDAPKGDTGHEWFEIYNKGELPVDVTKLKFSEGGTNHTIKNASIDVFLMSKSYTVIAQNTTQFIIDHPEYTGTPFNASFSLNNTGEPLMLITAEEGEILDYIFYDSVWGGNGTGFSLEKIDPNGPNTQENWNQSLILGGTPGQKNSISP